MKARAFIFLLAATLCPAEVRLTSLAISPAGRKLDGPGSSQQLLLIGQFSDGTERDFTDSAQWTVSNPKVAVLDSGALLKAIGDGNVVVNASAAGASARAGFEIVNTNAVRPFEFGRDIGTILTRQGCNGADCHGGVKGRGGFKLSAGSLHDKDDYEWITKGGTFQVLTTEVAGARVPRVDVKNPENSLLLRKPTFSVPHGGGKRFAKDSGEYKAILKWIQDGAPYGVEPKEGDRRLQRLEIFPRLLTLEKNGTHRVLVTAHFASGRVEDFTRQVRFLSNNPDIARVDETGRISAGKLGETAVLVQALGEVAPVTVGVIAAPVTGYPAVTGTNFIDDYILDKLRRFGVTPSPRSSDGEFLRRVCLDLTGTLPPPARVQEFLASRDPRKRENLIDVLMASPEFVDYWTFRFQDLFRVGVTANGVYPKWSEMYGEWVRDSIAANKPYDQMARERIVAEGFDGPTRHYTQNDDLLPPATTMAEEVRVFFGRRLDCAQCHNHPYENWSQDQFWGMAAFFGRQFALGDTGRDYVIFDHPPDEDLGNREVNRSLKLYHPRTKVELQPVLLDGTHVHATGHQNPRRMLADWMVRQSYFAEATANRMWSYFFGRGIADPIDDIRSTNPPTHPELLDRLAREFRAHHYDLRYLIRTIVGSSTYQFSGQANANNREDGTNYSHALPRALDAEILLDAICDVTAVPEVFTANLTGAATPTGKAPLGTRAVQLREPDLFFSRFLDVYGRPNRQAVPERITKANLGEALDMVAGDVYNRKLSNPEGRLQRMIQAGRTDAEIVDEFYLAAFARRPESDEVAAIEKLIAASRDRQSGLKDFVWAVLSSREFAENH